jgi:hypothetical protein
LSKIQLLPSALYAAAPSRLVWLEISSQKNPIFNPSSEKMISDWKKIGWKVEPQIIMENAFWQIINDTEVPLLCNATKNALLRFEA